MCAVLAETQQVTYSMTSFADNFRRIPQFTEDPRPYCSTDGSLQQMYANYTVIYAKIN